MSASFRAVVFSAAVILVGGCATVARAAPIDDCEKARWTAALSPCSQVIDNGNEKPATRSFALLLRARAELDLSDLGRAEADIGAALALTPESTFGYRLRARLRGLQGKETEARADLIKAVALSQSPAAKYASYLDRGYFFVRNMELPAALADFTAAVGIDATKAAAYVGRAVAAKAAGDIAKALADLDQAKAVEPAFKLTYLERGDILIAAKRYAEAVADFDAALALDAKDARALRGRAAASALASAAGIEIPPPKPVAAPNSPPPAPPNVAAPAATPSATPPSAPVATPGQSYAMPDPAPAQQPSPAPRPTPPQQATPAPQPAPAQQPPPAPQPTPPQQATPAPQPAPAQQAEPAPPPDPRSAKLKEALVLRQGGKNQEALAIYAELLRAAPADVEVAVEKARAHVALSQWKEALDLLKPVIESKTAPAPIKAFAFEAQGEALAQTSQYEAAILSNTAALAINPKLLGALFWRGASSFLLGAFDAAIADFRAGAAIAPNSPLLPGWEGLALVSTGDLAKAKEAIERSNTLAPDNAFALAARARLRLVAGEIDAAEADLATLARRGPLTGPALQTQQLIMIHKIFKPTDAPAAPKQ
jgi:tetratricopeptide (TPR) repeat protein